MLKACRSAVVVGVLSLLIGWPAVVVSADSSSTGAVVQSYSTDAAIRQGMIVGLDRKDATRVELVTRDTVTDTLGVAISASDAPLELTGSATTAQIYVATSGRYNVLVSNQNGAIQSGDYISVSSLNGIGMKADDNEAIVLGRAAAGFNGTGNIVSTATLQGASGTNTVTIGSIPVDINVGGNPNLGHGSGNLPGFLQVAGNTIASKPVSAPRVYLSMAVLLVTALISGGLLYSGVRGSIISIGRNPLARKSIIRGLIQVVITSIIVLILGLFAVYLLLRL